ncbi:uncharacterized protein LOC120204447 [Hibiscus syriacus]|uniref:uncharacterized protein LOC120204447 n=1 Tax=Hibiscus syriacus TaxID=106335 RepID=UPI0019248B5E|nr:uncharacterized protein LOC120204447 [Hibiscus syriacus]
MLDALANGTLLDKSPEESFDILDWIANIDYQFPFARLGTDKRISKAYELDSKNSVSAQLYAITNMLKNLQRSSEEFMASSKDFMASTKTMIQENSSTIKNQGNLLQSQSALLQSHSSSLRALENQVGQIAMALHSRPQGSLPSDTQVTTPQGKEQCSALTLRSAKEKERNEGSTSQHTNSEKLFAKEKVASPPVENKVRPPPPFPQWLKKHNDENHFKRFVDVLDQLHINVPLLGAIEKMPSYAKFLKDIVTKKRKVERMENVATTTEGCSPMSKNPLKQKDPGRFIIPCSISDTYVERALYDLGSNINLMPDSIFLKIGMGNARLTTVTLQLADRSHVCPEGRIEDVIVIVDKFVFPVDFLILDCEANENAPIILGRPFLATRRILIDCAKGEFTMRVADQIIIINVFNTLKYIDDFKECHYIEDINSLDEAGTENYGQGNFSHLNELTNFAKTVKFLAKMMFYNIRNTTLVITQNFF